MRSVRVKSVQDSVQLPVMRWVVMSAKLASLGYANVNTMEVNFS